MLEKKIQVKALPRVGPGAAAWGRYLKRSIGWTPKGFSWEADQNHVKRLTKDFGLTDEKAKGTDTPSSKETGKNVPAVLEDLNSPMATTFRQAAGVALFLAVDRMEIQLRSLKRSLCPRRGRCSGQCGEPTPG